LEQWRLLDIVKKNLISVKFDTTDLTVYKMHKLLLRLYAIFCSILILTKFPLFYALYLKYKQQVCDILLRGERLASTKLIIDQSQTAGNLLKHRKIIRLLCKCIDILKFRRITLLHNKQ